MRMMATETEAELACKDLRKIIEAAENSNQAGENAAVIAEDGARLRRALLKYAEELSTSTHTSAVAKDLRAICGEKHFHMGPVDQCRLCRRDFRASVHISWEREGS